jgi:hypothetical protein
MFIIKDINIGRFGNKLFYYNNLVQVANHFGHKYHAPRFNSDYIFEFTDNSEIFNGDTEFDIDKSFLLNNKDVLLNESNVKLQPCLGDLFF